MTRPGLAWRRRLASVAVLMSTAASADECQSVLAIDHQQVLDRVRSQIEGVSQIGDATLQALQLHDEVRVSSELAHACWFDERQSNRDQLWAIHWVYFHVENSLRTFAFSIQEKTDWRRERAHLLRNLAYAERYLATSHSRAGH